MNIVSLCVVSAHLLATLSLFYLHPAQPKITPHKPVAVHTCILDQPKKNPSSPISIEKISSPMLEIPQKEPSIIANKPLHPKPKPTPRSPTPHPKPTPTIKPRKEAVTPLAKKPDSLSRPNHDKLIAMMQNSLEALHVYEGKQPDEKPNLKPMKIQPLASEKLFFKQNYEEDLTLYLRSLLSLPEKGEVKLHLTLHKTGDVKKIEIVKTTSEQNKHYIESTLATSCFPPFSKQFKEEESHTFTILLTSENSH